jgi:6-phosphogluconolactonase
LTLVPNTQGSNTISGYAIDATTGALTPLPGSPFTVGSNPRSVALDPSSKFLYVANRVSSNISGFAVDGATGALTQIPGSPFPAGSEPDSVAVAPSGKFVYVSNQLSDNVWVYTIDSETGALTPINGSPFAAGHSPVALTMDPLGRFLYVSGNDTYSPDYDFLGFTIDSTTGALTQIPATEFTGGLVLVPWERLWTPRADSFLG